MGNSKNASGCQFPSGTAQADAGNGILAQIRGDIISDVKRLLPPPTTEGQRQEVLMEVDGIGPVRFYAQVNKVRHHKHSHLYWAAYRAEPVEAS
ncbi:hypothetical protein [Cupriavidus sp. IDO]|uniref:hypothetical protein n=1 Tax=Cupriavidus sp. IDO TaxID=1539142 RepID=UPI00057982F9|nr:hypothetical protein [Cupriavidus sp. IDO]KWR88743.1 hypothetical protein RM96_17670 [Cupriavidus sp. IDO]